MNILHSKVQKLKLASFFSSAPSFRRKLCRNQHLWDKCLLPKKHMTKEVVFMQEGIKDSYRCTRTRKIRCKFVIFMVKRNLGNIPRCIESMTLKLTYSWLKRACKSSLPGFHQRLWNLAELCILTGTAGGPKLDFPHWLHTWLLFSQGSLFSAMFFPPYMETESNTQLCVHFLWLLFFLFHYLPILVKYFSNLNSEIGKLLI